MKKELLILLWLPFCFSLTGNTYYVSPGGKDTNPGSISQPFFTINKAWSVISAGDIVYLRGGTYSFNTSMTVLEDKSGTSGKPIKIWAYPGENPVIDYSGVVFSSQKIGIRLHNSNYIHLKGIRISNLAQPTDGNVNYGIILYNEVSNCIFELMQIDHIGGMGIVLADDCNNNLFLNCDSHHNQDPLSSTPYDGSDGFETGSHTPGHTSTNNIFRGCRAWWNSDDGWDLRQADGIYTIENCWSFWNGYIAGTFESAGNGEGFKLGGKTAPATNTILRKIQNSIAFENRRVGFSPEPDLPENNFGVEMYNCVSYRNIEGLNFNYGSISLLRNNISYKNNENYRVGVNCTHDHNSFDLSVTVSDEDFITLSSNGVDGPRQADGSLPNLNFLRLAEGSDLIDAGVDVGMSYGGTAPDLGAFESQNPTTTAVPVLISSVIEDATPSLLEITFDLNLNKLVVPEILSFNVLNNSVARKVNNVVVSGTKVQLTLESPIVYGDVVTVSYIKPSQNPLQTITGGQVESFSAMTVFNNCVKPLNPEAPPVVVINYPKTVYEGFVSEIDATSTFDPNNDSLMFEWEVPKDVPVLTVNRLKTQFLAPVVNNSKTVAFQLKVSNGVTILSNDIPIDVLPYKPQLISARIAGIDANDFQIPNFPSNILDGNTATCWSSIGVNEWLILKLAEPFKISHLELAFLPGQKYASYFDIYASKDNLTWEPVLIQVSSCSFSGERQVFDFPLINTTEVYLYLKYIGHGNSLNSLNYISEFKVFGSPQKFNSSSDAEKRKIIIYPNPIQDYLNISIEEPTLEFDKIRIIDLSGRIVFKEFLNPIIKNVQIPINLKSGVYLVDLSLDNLVLFTQKLFIKD